MRQDVLNQSINHIQRYFSLQFFCIIKSNISNNTKYNCIFQVFPMLNITLTLETKVFRN